MSVQSAVDCQYFNSYDDTNVHQLMLKDMPRIEAYRNFIENNTTEFANKIIVDVGSGTGILSLLAARAGAKHVCILQFFLFKPHKMKIEIQHSTRTVEWDDDSEWVMIIEIIEKCVCYDKNSATVLCTSLIF